MGKRRATFNEESDVGLTRRTILVLVTCSKNTTQVEDAIQQHFLSHHHNNRSNPKTSPLHPLSPVQRSRSHPTPEPQKRGPRTSPNPPPQSPSPSSIPPSSNRGALKKWSMLFPYPIPSLSISQTPSYQGRGKLVR